MQNWHSKVKESLKDLASKKFNLDETYLEAPVLDHPIDDQFVIQNYMGISEDFDYFLNTFEHFNVDFHCIYGSSERFNLCELKDRFERFLIPAELKYIGHDCGSDPLLINSIDGSVYRLNRRENNTFTRLADTFGEFIRTIIYGRNHIKLYPGESYEEIKDDWTEYLRVKGWA